MATIDDLKKLSPKERIQKLKDLQDKNKQEIEQAQKMLSQAVDEAVVEDELRDIPVPQLKVEDIDALFSPEERELFKAKRFISDKKKEDIEEENEIDLEDIAAAAPPSSPAAEQQHIEYIQNLSKQPADALMDRASNIYEQFKEQGYLSPSQQEEMGNIAYANQQKMQDIQTGSYSQAGPKIENEIMTIQKMMNATYKQ